MSTLLRAISRQVLPRTTFWRGIKVHVTDVQGKTRTVNAKAGETLLAAAKKSNVPIKASCGGLMTCGDCHVFVQDHDKYEKKWNEIDEEEEEALKTVPFANESSRLSCALEITADMEGMKVTHVPKSTKKLPPELQQGKSVKKEPFDDKKKSAAKPSPETKAAKVPTKPPEEKTKPLQRDTCSCVLNVTHAPQIGVCILGRGDGFRYS